MKDIVIIGAGPAGLTAAYELLKHKDYNVIILEKSDRIGGISQTARYKGNRMDIGGHRFFTKDDRVNEWWQKIMPIQGKPSFDDKILNREKDYVEGGPDPEIEDRVMLIRNRISRIYYLKKFFDYPVSLKMETLKNMGFITTMKAGFSYINSVINKLPEDNLENFYINRFGKVLYSMFFEGYTEKVWGRHPSKISADWGSQRAKGLSVTAVLKDVFKKIVPGKGNGEVETSLIEEYTYPKLGPGQLWETVANDVQKMGGKILMNCEVKELNTEDGKINSLTYVKDNEEKQISGDIFMSSMPINDLIAGIKGSSVPDLVKNAAADLPFRDFITVGLLLKKLNLKNQTNIKTLNNIVPDCWIYVQDTGVNLGRIQIFNNWSPYMVQDPEKYVWVGLEYFCLEGDEFWEMSDEKFIEMAINELISMDIIEKEDVIDSHRERIQKAYPAYFDGYEYIDEIIEYLNSFNNLYCIGRNGQHRYNNMDHSMATSFEAVDNIVNNIEDKSNVWNVNTEKEYHEIKK